MKLFFTETTLIYSWRDLLQISQLFDISFFVIKTLLKLSFSSIFFCKFWSYGKVTEVKSWFFFVFNVVLYSFCLKCRVLLNKWANVYILAPASLSWGLCWASDGAVICACAADGWVLRNSLGSLIHGYHHCPPKLWGYFKSLIIWYWIVEA